MGTANVIQNPRIRSCYISAPAGSNLKVLRSALDKRQIRVTAPSDFAVGTIWSPEFSHPLATVDLVIGILTAERRSDWVLFEVGQAFATKRQILLFVPPKGIAYFPLDLKGMLAVRASLTNREAIEFALDQLLAAPEPKAIAATEVSRGGGLGERADQLILEVNQAITGRQGTELERIIERVLRESGVEALSTEFKNEPGADVAVWSDALQQSVGNPLLIEVKIRLTDRRRAREVASQLAKQALSSGTRWGLLLYGEGPSSSSIQQSMPPNVLAMSIVELIERMRYRPFAEVVTRLRNERVHGVSG
jgi:hypothetical protein